MKIIDRIFQYIDFKGIKPRPFELQIGLSNGYLAKQQRRNADLGESIILKIIENCPEINPYWLWTGEGEMLKTKCKENVPLEKGNNLGSILGNKPNVKKTLPFESPPPGGSGTEVTALREVIEAQRQQITGLNQQITSLNQDKERLINDIQEVKEEKNELKEEVKELRHQLKLATKEIEYLKNVSSMEDTQAQVG